MAPEDIPKEDILIPFGLFEYLCMPFGLKNMAQSFQNLLDNIFFTAVLHGRPLDINQKAFAAPP
jgi:hypothetical protein